MTGQRRPEETPIKAMVNYPEGHDSAAQRLSLSLPVCLSVGTVLFPPNTYLTCSTTFPLCGNSFLQAEGPGPLSLTTGLVASICPFPFPVQSLAGNQETTPGHCTRDQVLVHLLITQYIHIGALVSLSAIFLVFTWFGILRRQGVSNKVGTFLSPSLI